MAVVANGIGSCSGPIRYTDTCVLVGDAAMHMPEMTTQIMININSAGKRVRVTEHVMETMETHAFPLALVTATVQTNNTPEMVSVTPVGSASVTDAVTDALSVITVSDSDILDISDISDVSSDCDGHSEMSVDRSPSCSPSESIEFQFDRDDPQHLVDCGLATTYDEASSMLRTMDDPDIFASFYPILYENFRVRDFDNDRDPTRVPTRA